MSMSGLPEAPQPVRAPQRLTVPGCPLAVEAMPPERPGLPPALFVHGLGGSSQNWTLLMDRLAGDVDGHALDLPGFGQSPPPDDGDLSVTAHMWAVVDYLELSGRGPVHLFGNSLGGAVATRLAALRPDLVRTLTLVSPALPEVPPQTSALPTALLAVPGVPALFGRLTDGRPAEQQTEALLNLCYGDPGTIDAQRRAEMAAEYRRRMALPYSMDVLVRSARGIVRAYTERGPQALWRQAEQVTAPVLLVYGLRDKLVSYRMARRSSQAFRDSRLMVLPEAGHVAMMEYPELVAGAFRELVAGTAVAAEPSGPAPAEPTVAGLP
ncbi:alpha/beta hydrolase [Streptacidiphilus sp. PB12-B1b]|uniref:alpha/beta fold hydrolase n=1 Tax=Streptacidiphilus sp. PB12-B1b TaxID=2705012 RepID=UPI0015FD16A4|nr:alpha/beta hydrolase [Streptacidiphilus sp. PB12-B1b]QMU75214.1 alpha/beta hydrolase [Streptacidiphilus sp. PB12-B1b]